MDNNIFPLPFEFHLAFVCIAVLLFIVRFIMQKRTYQIFMSVAVALTMLLHINDSKMWYYIVGIVDLILIVGSVISVIQDRKNSKALKNVEKAEEAVQQ